DHRVDIQGLGQVGLYAAADAQFQAIEVFDGLHFFFGGVDAARPVAVYAQKLDAAMLVGALQVLVVGAPCGNGGRLCRVAREGQDGELHQVEAAGVVRVRNERQVDHAVAHRVKMP